MAISTRFEGSLLVNIFLWSRSGVQSQQFKLHWWAPTSWLCGQRPGRQGGTSMALHAL